MQQLKRLKKRLNFVLSFKSFQKLQAESQRRMLLSWQDRYPCLDDISDATSFDRHYVFHLAWAARILKQLGISKHVDISSSLHFCTLVSAFIAVDFYDYRPADLKLSGLTSKRADLRKLPFENNSIASLSCMHVVEHVGLGRYGDPLDAEGDLKAVKELTRVLAPGGSLLFVVPVGRPKIMFNAHRVYSYEQVLDFFNSLNLQQFALIPDDSVQGGLIVDAPPALVAKQIYGCGCFWFKKNE